MAIEHADFDGIERLSLVTGGEIVSTFGRPELVKLGHCDLIEEVFFFYVYFRFNSSIFLFFILSFEPLFFCLFQPSIRLPSFKETFDNLLGLLK